ncbi:hypothetical protein GP475_08780 [Corynebacterium poyangense]|uniref:Uncharacterized protein n=1 Tax=Corynebacterium poyangense TaxID=2684405 RepID=A0A7H0SQ96_9CORY|nr:hypothetical protein [Corynebacterium poyangense]QNQ90721.1 hypothetical protein GP475_08780 [Corynebacterium poyangense]
MLRSTAAKDMVTVVLREMRMGEHGRMIPTEIGHVTVLGRLQQGSTEDIQTYISAGEKGVLNLKRFYCRNFPGDDLSLVIDEEGITYRVVGEPKRHRGSRRTARDVVNLTQTAVKRGVRNG